MERLLIAKDDELVRQIQYLELPTRKCATNRGTIMDVSRIAWKLSRPKKRKYRDDQLVVAGRLFFRRERY